MLICLCLTALVTADFSVDTSRNFIKMGGYMEKSDPYNINLGGYVHPSMQD